MPGNDVVNTVTKTSVGEFTKTEDLIETITQIGTIAVTTGLEESTTVYASVEVTDKVAYTTCVAGAGGYWR